MPPAKTHQLKNKPKEARGRGRQAKACAQCRTGKTRCDFAPDAERCMRCTHRGIECTPLEGTVPHKHAAAHSQPYPSKRPDLAAAKKPAHSRTTSTSWSPHGDDSTATSAKPSPDTLPSTTLPPNVAPPVQPSSAGATPRFPDSPSLVGSDSAVSPYPLAPSPANGGYRPAELGSRGDSRLSIDSFIGEDHKLDFGGGDEEKERALTEIEKSLTERRLAREEERRRRNSMFNDSAGLYAGNLDTLISAATSNAPTPTSSFLGPLAGPADEGEIDVNEDDMNANVGLEIEFPPELAGIPFGSHTANLFGLLGLTGTSPGGASTGDSSSSHIFSGPDSAGSGTHRVDAGSGSLSDAGAHMGVDPGSGLVVTPAHLSYPFAGTPDITVVPNGNHITSNNQIPPSNRISKASQTVSQNGSQNGSQIGGQSSSNNQNGSRISPWSPNSQGLLQDIATSGATGDSSARMPPTLASLLSSNSHSPAAESPSSQTSSSGPPPPVAPRPTTGDHAPSHSLNDIGRRTDAASIARDSPLTTLNANSRPGERLALTCNRNLLANQQFNFQNSVTHMALRAIGPGLRSRMGAASLLMAPARAHGSARNVITAKVMSRTEVIKLMSLFKGNYDHWIGLPDGDTEQIVDGLLDKCPLLVTTCCSIALRFGSVRLWQTVYPLLVRYLSSELAQTLIQPPRNTECVQALTILAKYADSLSFGDQVFDMWSISGTGIQHLESIITADNRFSYMHMRLWNHLVLAHLCSANTTGRHVVVSDAGMELCSKVLEGPVPTRFDKCMMAELMIQWQTNRYLSHQIRFSEFEQEVEKWRAKWGSLAQLPMIQFIEPVLLFCSFLTRWTHSRRCWVAAKMRQSRAKSSETTAYIGDHYNQDDANANSDIDPEDATAVASVSITDDLSGACMENMLTSELLTELGSLNAIMISLLQLVEPKYFVCLSDSIHQIGFLSGIMALVISKIILRREIFSREVAKPLENCDQLVKQLASRFRATSRGQDVAYTQFAALTELLNTVNLASAIMTPPSTNVSA